LPNSCPVSQNRSNFYDLVAKFSNKKEAKANALTSYIPKSFPFLLSD